MTLPKSLRAVIEIVVGLGAVIGIVLFYVVVVPVLALQRRS